MIMMMNDDETDKLIELLDGIIEISGSYGAAFKATADAAKKGYV